MLSGLRDRGMKRYLKFACGRTGPERFDKNYSLLKKEEESVLGYVLLRNLQNPHVSM